jgi:hypothetical protein
MDAEDPRHGTPRGYSAHRRAGQKACTDCKNAAAAQEARYELRRIRGEGSILVDPTGTRRRLRALVAIGWTFRQIDRELGRRVNTSQQWTLSARKYTHARTAAAVAEVYERLSMRMPPANTREERANATRARALAKKQGWPPPLAWDNIDDPDEQPRGWQYEGTTRKTRAELLADLDARHAGITEVCATLKIKRDSVERWCNRHGLTDLYIRLVDREYPNAERHRHPRRNTQQGAA